MKFLKEKSYDIVRLFIYQIGIAIFSLFLYTAVNSAIPEDKADLKLLFTLLLSVFAIGFYFVLLYLTTWEWGAKEKIRIDAGKSVKKPFEGSLICAFANVPNVLLSLTLVIIALIYVKVESEPLGNAYFIINLIVRFIESMYLGVIMGVRSLFELELFEQQIFDSVGFLILPFFSVVAAHLGYSLGLMEKTIFPRIKKKYPEKS